MKQCSIKPVEAIGKNKKSYKHDCVLSTNVIKAYSVITKIKLPSILENGGSKKFSVKFFYKHKKIKKVLNLIFVVSLVVSDVHMVDTLSGPRHIYSLDLGHSV